MANNVTLPGTGAIVETLDQGAGVERQVVSAVQNGTWTVQPGNTANTTAWKVDGSAVTQPVSAASLPLPTGAAADSSLTTLHTDLTGGTQLAVVTGNVASAATDSGNPVKVGGIYNTTKPTFTNGQRGDIQVGARGAMLVQLTSADSVNAVATLSAGADGAGTGINAITAAAIGFTFNGASLDRLRGNIDTAALVTLSAAAAGTTNSSDQTNYNGRGVQIVVDITAATAMTLTVNIQGKDAASGKYYTILASAAFAATGTNQLTVYPGAAVTANVSINQPLPRVWRVQAVVTGTSVTATVGASVIL